MVNFCWYIFVNLFIIQTSSLLLFLILTLSDVKAKYKKLLFLINRNSINWSLQHLSEDYNLVFTSAIMSVVILSNICGTYSIMSTSRTDYDELFSPEIYSEYVLSAISSYSFLLELSEFGSDSWSRESHDLLDYSYSGNNNIYTHIIWSFQAFRQEYDIASHTTYVVC